MALVLVGVLKGTKQTHFQADTRTSGNWSLISSGEDTVYNTRIESCTGKG